MGNVLSRGCPGPTTVSTMLAIHTTIHSPFRRGGEHGAKIASAGASKAYGLCLGGL